MTRSCQCRAEMGCVSSWAIPKRSDACSWAFPSYAPTRQQGGMQSDVRDRPRDAEPRQHSEILYLHVGSAELKSDPSYRVQVTLAPSPK